MNVQLIIWKWPFSLEAKRAPPYFFAKLSEIEEFFNVIWPSDRLIKIAPPLPYSILFYDKNRFSKFKIPLFFLIKLVS